MSDATERGGALASVYREIKKKMSGEVRIDKNKAIETSAQMATLRGHSRAKAPSVMQKAGKPVTASKKPAKF